MNTNIRSRVAIFISILTFIIATVTTIAYASTSVGTIDNGSKITRICQDATCSTYGQINFKPTIITGVNPMTITDTSITGHAWGDQIGWINLNPSGLAPSDVLKVDPATGIVTGKAYASTGGWINFSPTGAGVTLVDNGSGSNFSGFAWVSGNFGGWIKFDCASPSTCVKTDWRTTSNRSVVTPPTPTATTNFGSLLSVGSSTNNNSNSTNTPNNNNLVTSDQAAGDINNQNNTNANNSNSISSKNSATKVKNVLPLTPGEVVPAFPSDNVKSNQSREANYREIFPLYATQYTSDGCLFCLQIRVDRFKIVDEMGNINIVNNSRILKYGFVPDSFEYGISFGAKKEDGLNVGLTSTIITLIVLYITWLILKKKFFEPEVKSRSIRVR